MLKNFLKITWRNLIKNKGYSVINILGLAVGLASCLLILVYVLHESSFDKFHEKSDRIYRVVQTYTSETKEDAGASTPFRLGPTLENEFPQSIVTSVRLFNMQTPKLSLGFKEEERFFKEENFFFADSTIFEVFSFELIRGNPDNALDQPQSLVISESMAEKYFGNVDPMGKTLFFEGRMDLTVTGIMKDLPTNTHFNADFLASFSSLYNFYRSEFDHSWYWNPCWTYILVEENTSIDQIESQIDDFIDQYYHANLPETEEVTVDFQALPDIHLFSDLEQELSDNGDIQSLYIFSAIAFIILLVACINFMNLATARSLSRAKEVGMRKTLGATRNNLIVQFLGESFILTLLASILAISIIFLIFPAFSIWLNLQLDLSILNSGIVWGGLGTLILMVGLLAGLYPAFFLSRYQPVKTLRGEITKSRAAWNFRRVLVVFQFTLSVFLIVGTVLIYQQLTFMQNKDLGFEKENTVIIPTALTRTIWYFDDYRQEILANSNINKVTGVSTVLGSLKNYYYKYQPENAPEEESFPAIFVMYDFIDTYNIELLAGRSFSEEISTDRTQSILINKKMVDQMGWGTPSEALGKSFTHNDQTHFVIGVTDDFHHTSLRKEVEPVIIDMPDEEFDIVSSINNIVVKINGEDRQAALKALADSWKNYDRSHPFDYFFHSDELNEIYSAELTLANVATAFTILCIIVACLGLFGLIAYMTEMRQKEIGIRKSLGAGLTNIVGLITKDYMKLILISNFIALPLIYFPARYWLQQFPHRISLGSEIIPVFIFTVFVILIISAITVSYHAIKAAMINPATTLKSE